MPSSNKPRAYSGLGDTPALPLYHIFSDPRSTTSSSYSTYSFFLLAGMTGTNVNFAVPVLVTVGCFFTKLPIAFGIVDEAEAPGRALPEAPCDPDAAFF